MKTPLPFQTFAVARALPEPGFIIGDECGLGKTIEGIEIVKAARLGNETNWRTLIIVPKKLAPQWEDVIHDQDPGQEVLIARAIPWDFTKIYGYVIVTYPEIQGGYGPKLHTVLWDFLMVDEAHRMNNRTTVQTTSIKSIPAAKRIALTGTPWEGHSGEIWSLLNYIRADMFPSWWTFAKEWLIEEPGYFDQFAYGGPKDPELFGKMLSNYMIRRRKSEVFEDFPEKIVEWVRVEMHPIQANKYKQLIAGTDIVVKVDDQELLIQNVLTAITRAQQLSSWPESLNMHAASGKMEWVQDFITDHPEVPIIVFSRFRDPMEYLADKFKAALVLGGSDGSLDFIEGRTNVCCCTIDSIEGVDGLQRARYAIFLDSHWSSVRMTQAMDRIHRTGITENKIIYLLHSCREDLLVLKAYEEKLTEAELVEFYLQAE